MLRVTIEHLPSDSNKPRELLAELDICNVSGDTEVADYTLLLKAKGIKGITTGMVSHYQQRYGFLPLVSRAIRELWGA